jgi:YbbR domain-containing protein
MLHFITENFGWKLLSLIAAFLIWANIASEPELTTILSAPVEYKNFPKGLEISSEIVETVDVETHGAAGQLRDLSASHLAAIVDFSSVRAAGERTFTLTTAELNLPRGIQLIRIIPAQLRFKFEPGVTRSIPVQVPFAGKLPAGWKLASFGVTPAALTIAGPQSRVQAVVKAASDPFDLSQVSGDAKQKLSVYIGEPQVRFLEVPQVTVSIHVERSN